VAVDDLAEEHGATVAELRVELAELVSRVGGGDRVGARGQGIAGQRAHAGVAAQARSLSMPSSARQRLVDTDQRRFRTGSGICPAR
jgi:hypothetical protein